MIDAGVLFYDDAAHLEIGSIRGVVTGQDETIVRVQEEI